MFELLLQENEFTVFPDEVCAIARLQVRPYMSPYLGPYLGLYLAPICAIARLQVRPAMTRAPSLR